MSRWEEWRKLYNKNRAELTDAEVEFGPGWEMREPPGTSRVFVNGEYTFSTDLESERDVVASARNSRASQLATTTMRQKYGNSWRNQ